MFSRLIRWISCKSEREREGGIRIFLFSSNLFNSIRSDSFSLLFPPLVVVVVDLKQTIERAKYLKKKYKYNISLYINKKFSFSSYLQTTYKQRQKYDDVVRNQSLSSSSERTNKLEQRVVSSRARTESETHTEI